MDGCAGKPGRYHPVNVDTSIKLPVEVKPLFRPKKSMKNLDDESKRQIVGHLAKSAYQGLKVWEIGTSTWATGVTANPVYIIVYRLELVMEVYCGDRKPFVKLQLAGSVKLPLMTKKCFKKWFEKCEAANAKKFSPIRRKEIKNLEQELYGTAEMEINVDTDGVPRGIRVVRDLLWKRRIDLFGPDYQKIMQSSGNKDIGELLGTGSFGLVFSYSMEKDADTVLKVPLLLKSAHLERELSILRILKRVQDPNTTIDEDRALPVVMKVLYKIPVMLGGLEQEVKGLVLSPQGVPLPFSAKEMKKLEVSSLYDQRVVYVWSQLESTLRFIHGKNVYHNDVSPKNIVVCDADWSVCLVDFGSAFHNCRSTSDDDNKKTMTGFEGTSNYAHLDVFMCYPRNPWKYLDGRYDFFGLCLTVSALFNGGEACWDMKPFPASMTDDKRNLLCDLLSERREKAIDKINESGCSMEQKAKWIEHIKSENLTDLRRKGNATPSSGGDSSQVPLQEPEPESLQHLPGRMSLSSRTKRKGNGTTDDNTTGPPPSSGGDSSEIPLQEPEPESLQHLPTRMSLRSRPKRKENGTTDDNTTGPPPKKRRRS